MAEISNMHVLIVYVFVHCCGRRRTTAVAAVVPKSGATKKEKLYNICTLGLALANFHQPLSAHINFNDKIITLGAKL